MRIRQPNFRNSPKPICAFAGQAKQSKTPVKTYLAALDMVNAAVSGAPCSLYNALQKIENNILAFKELFTFYTVEDIQGVNNFFV